MSGFVFDLDIQKERDYVEKWARMQNSQWKCYLLLSKK